MQFGKYRLLDTIGQGGMAEVFYAHLLGSEGFTKEVALKLVRPDLSRNEEFIQSFQDEARLGGLLNHQNIVQTLDFGYEQGLYYLAMEYVHGLTLRDIINHHLKEQQYIPPTVFIDISLQLCEGLRYAHEAEDADGTPLHMVHRDLKPTNIMVTSYGIIKIADFGIARAATNQRQTLVEGTLRGTAQYMSPEQAVGDLYLDRRSDIFSLGSILFEMITLRSLFYDAAGFMHTLKNVQEAQVGGNLEAMARAHPYAAPMAPLLQSMLALDRNERPQDFSEIITPLRRLGGSLSRVTDVRHWMEQLLISMGKPVKSRRSYSQLDVGSSNPKVALPPFRESSRSQSNFVIGPGTLSGNRATPQSPRPLTSSVQVRPELPSANDQHRGEPSSTPAPAGPSTYTSGGYPAVTAHSAAGYYGGVPSTAALDATPTPHPDTTKNSPSPYDFTFPEYRNATPSSAQGTAYPTAGSILETELDIPSHELSSSLNPLAATPTNPATLSVSKSPYRLPLLTLIGACIVVALLSGLAQLGMLPNSLSRTKPLVRFTVDTQPSGAAVRFGDPSIAPGISPVAREIRHAKDCIDVEINRDGYEAVKACLPISQEGFVDSVKLKPAFHTTDVVVYFPLDLEGISISIDAWEVDMRLRAVHRPTLASVRIFTEIGKRTISVKSRDCGEVSQTYDFATEGAYKFLYVARRKSPTCTLTLSQEPP